MLQSSEDQQDIVEKLISDGLLAVEKRRESKLRQLVSVNHVVVLDRNRI